MQNFPRRKYVIYFEKAEKMTELEGKFIFYTL